jgi:transcription elongation factor S-II
MVVVTVVQPSGTLSLLTIPAKTEDVLVWLRTKTKQPELQFQGKIQIHNKEQWVTIFSESGKDDEDDDDKINQHVLGGNFQDEIFIGVIVVMLSTNSNADNYDKLPSAYLNLKPSDYETVYANWTSNDDDDDEDEDGDGDGIEDGAAAVVDDDDDDDDDDDAASSSSDEDGEVVGAAAVEDDDADEEKVVIPKKRAASTGSRSAAATAAAAGQPADVNTPCPLRDLVVRRYTELGVECANALETAILQRCIRECAKQGIDTTWTNTGFWNHYRGRCIQFYENMRANGGAWITRLNAGEITPEPFAELSAVDLCPERWKKRIEIQIEKDKHLYTNSGTASIYFYCSGCKKKSKCDYYQMQTRSADEPMTTFVTCLECDKKWKF